MHQLVNELLWWPHPSSAFPLWSRPSTCNLQSIAPLHPVYPACYAGRWFSVLTRTCGLPVLQLSSSLPCLLLLQVLIPFFLSLDLWHTIVAIPPSTLSTPFLPGKRSSLIHLSLHLPPSASTLFPWCSVCIKAWTSPGMHLVPGPLAYSNFCSPLLIFSFLQHPSHELQYDFIYFPGRTKYVLRSPESPKLWLAQLVEGITRTPGSMPVGVGGHGGWQNKHYALQSRHELPQI